MDERLNKAIAAAVLDAWCEGTNGGDGITASDLHPRVPGPWTLRDVSAALLEGVTGVRQNGYAWAVPQWAPTESAKRALVEDLAGRLDRVRAAVEGRS